MVLLLFPFLGSDYFSFYFSHYYHVFPPKRERELFNMFKKERKTFEMLLTLSLPFHFLNYKLK